MSPLCQFFNKKEAYKMRHFSAFRVYFLGTKEWYLFKNLYVFVKNNYEILFLGGLKNNILNKILVKIGTKI